MKYIASVLFIVLIIFQIKLWFGNYGVFQLALLNRTIEQNKSDNDQLQVRNEQLHSEVFELTEKKEALEDRARSQLGFIKDGEVFYRIIPPSDKKNDKKSN